MFQKRLSKPHHSIYLCAMTFLLWPILAISAPPQTTYIEDYSLTTYANPYTQEADHIELFTKSPKREAFFGLTCSRGNSLPNLQILLFDQAVISSTPKLMSIQYQILPKSNPAVSLPLQGVLKATATEPRQENRIRLELPPQSVQTFQQLQQQYRQLLSQLREGTEIQIQVAHRMLGEHKFTFSLNGLDAFLSTHESLCF